MRTNRIVGSVCLCGFLLVACARFAGAQTYIWTDERGVVHAAADPSEVPAKYRQKAVRDASRTRPEVKIVPDEQVPAAPAAAARGHASDPVEQSNDGINLDANPNTGPGAPDDNPKGRPKGAGPHGLPPADEGFEWHCATDPEGGPPHCQQLEKKYHKRERRAQARENARKDLGVEPTDEFDPDVAKKVNKRAQEEFDKTTPEPTTKGVLRPDVEDDIGSDSSESEE